MRKNPSGYIVADPEFYAPLETCTDQGEPFRPARIPDGWRSRSSGLWTVWHRDGLGGVEDGWKVHVSARPDRLAEVLDATARVCFAQGVPFKHLASRLFHLCTHYPHGSRAQNGKFIAAYPPDVPTARGLMERLSEELDGEEGPFILTDRRFGTSRTVHYRYGAFVHRPRTRGDGTSFSLVRDGHGRLVEDRRGVEFHLPEGITDPFVTHRGNGSGRQAAAADAGSARTAAPDDAGADGPPVFNGFAFEGAIRFSNAGGTYRGRETSTGRTVFVKEARAHCGVLDDGSTAPENLRREWETLRRLHALAPGLAPEPRGHFQVWEHHFMVTELVPGVPLSRWLNTAHPMLSPPVRREELRRYYQRCLRIISAVERAIERLHAVGYLFGDVSPGNVLVDEDDQARLVDFGAARSVDEPPSSVGTPGYTPPPGMAVDDPAVKDDYGVSALAHLLLGPLRHEARRNPHILAHQHHELSRYAPVPKPLWDRATRYDRPRGTAELPGPEEVATEPERHLAGLRDGVADALVAMADADHVTRMFPTIMEGYALNTLCVAYGAAGVLHALRRAGRPAPDGVLERLRKDALAAEDLPPGLYAGTAGIARVLADHGLLTEAVDLLGRADRHPLTRECATLFGGAAGVAMAHLAVHGHTGDPRHLDRALGIAAGLPPDDLLRPHLGPDDATGLLHGRCGIALMLQQLAAVTGDTSHLARGVRLLHAELDRACDPDAPTLTFPVSASDSRRMAYLSCGSAGMVHTVTRYLGVLDDDRLAEALPRLLAPLRLTFTVMPGLYQGLAGRGFALAEHAALTGDQESRRAAVRVGRALFKYVIPHPTGVRVLGDQSLRYSAELFSGSAGVLLFLSDLLDPEPDALFTVDALAARPAPTPA
ncbi:class III lanthionine synthetase LanKC [Streptomyces sp. WMMC1477]|uniref:class III lanthionine synthetase LanKC n=1 Tax=Streptomyces sp. WMMC1477 TaxID=3015155 RepID=UPI0022B7059B|nr:class III lanthionine synthetase LanKC [Streptomyces sp. WMMC1477]MCZ7434055.1 class III lanthionine synthetase LanKC [Streptomyces sp. WMMC1477]